MEFLPRKINVILLLPERLQVKQAAFLLFIEVKESDIEVKAHS
jgi:hypothetical protein